MIRDSLRRRVSALEHDRQEREKFTGAATEQALASRPIHREGTASPVMAQGGRGDNASGTMQAAQGEAGTGT